MTPVVPAAPLVSHLTPAQLGPTLAVWAHPDDETYLAGGLLAALRDRGERVVCVTATRGEAADPASTPEQRQSLAALRTRELESAAAILGLEEHIWLDLPDGACSSVGLDEVVERLVGIADEMAAQTVLTFGPDGVTGHADHRAVSAWVSAAAPLMRTRPRVLHAAFTPEEMAEFRDVNEGYDVYVDGQPRLCQPEELVVHLQLSGASLDRKVEALLAQASQTAPLVEALGRDRYAAWVSHESFADPLVDEQRP